MEDPNPGTVAEGRIIKSDGSAVTNEFHINPPATTIGFEPDVAGLKGGNFVAVYADTKTDIGGDIRGRFFSATGASGPTCLSTRAQPTTAIPQVAALTDGGFVVATQRISAAATLTCVRMYSMPTGPCGPPA